MTGAQGWLAGLFWLAGMAAGLGTAAAARTPATVDAGSCTSLAAKAWPDMSALSASWQPAGPAEWRDGSGKTNSALFPAHCILRGTSSAYRDSEGHAYGVGIELRLPQGWNGRLFFQGGGGLDGAVLPAFGAVTGGAPGLARGFAVVSMDGGHEGRDAAFAANQQARLDFAYAAIGKTVRFAKAAIAGFYGQAASRSYFLGCSNGGREAMMAADRYPMEFDGIVAGDPGFHLSHAALEEAWANEQWAAIAPRGAEGHPDLAGAFSDADLLLVARRVMADCDALDGLKDGMINNAAACRFTPQEVQCGLGATDNCLSPAKVAALTAVFGPLRDASGQMLYPGFPFDTGIAQPNWRLWMLGSPGGHGALNETLGAQSLALYFMTPQQPGRDPMHLNLQTAAADVAQTPQVTTRMPRCCPAFPAMAESFLYTKALATRFSRRWI